MRVFTPVVTGAGSVPEATTRVVLFLVVGAEEARAITPIEADLGATPAAVRTIVAGLRLVTPFGPAIQQGSLAFAWAPTSGIEADAISPTWVLSQLRGARNDLQDEILTGGDRMPYAGSAGGIVVLTVVVHPDLPWGEDTSAFGTLPYYVAVTDDPFGVARCLGKVLGLGEESTDPQMLSAPDFWGRSFPNLWFDRPGTPSAPPPWPEPYATSPQEGGFGSDGWATPTETVWRPEPNCLMGGGDAFCAVCREHLTRILLGNEPELTLEPAISLDPDVLGTVTITRSDGTTIRLWSSISPRRTVLGSVVEPEVEPVVSEDGRAVEVCYCDGLVLRTALVEHRTSLGRTVTLEMEAWQDGDPSSASELSVSATTDPALDGTLATLEVTGDPEIEKVAVRWWIADPVWASAEGETDRMNQSESGMEDFHARLIAAADGLLPREEAEKTVLDWADWWWVGPDEAAPASPVTLAWRATAGTSPVVSGAGVVLAGRGLGDATMWPTGLQGEGTPALLLLLTRVRVRELADSSAVLRNLAYVQCTGVSDVWRHGVHTSPGWQYWPGTVGATTRFGRLLGLAECERLTLRWADLGIPQHLDRLHRVLAGDAGAPLIWPPEASIEQPEALRERLKTALIYSADAERDAQALQAALWWIQALPPGLADFAGVISDAYVRILLILVRWALADDIPRLLANYPVGSDFQTDLLGTELGLLAATFDFSETHPGWKAFVARVRALLGDHASIALTLSTRIHTFYPDVEAIGRAARSLSMTQLDELREPAGVTAVFHLTATVTAGLFDDDDDAALALAQDIANHAARMGAQSGYETLSQGGADLWNRAASRYLDARPSTGPIPALRLLAQTPPGWRAGFLAAVTPSDPDAADAYAYVADLDDVLMLEHLVERVLTSPITDDVWADALAVFGAAGAMVKARAAVVETCEQILEDLPDDATYDTLTAIAEVQRDLELAEAASDATIAILHSETIRNAIHVVDFGAGDPARRAACLAALGVSEAEHHVHRLIAITAHEPLLAAFAALPAEAMDSVRTHELFTAHLVAEELPDHFDGVLQAVVRINALAEEAEPATDDLVTIAAHRAWQLAQEASTLTAAVKVFTLDRSIASLVAAVAQVPAGERSRLAANSVYASALGALESTYAMGVVLTASHTTLDALTTADLATTARALSVRTFAGEERIWLPETYAEYLTLHVGSLAAKEVDGVSADGHTQMRFALALASDNALLPSLTERASLVEEHAAIRDLIETSVQRGIIDEESAESIRDALYQLPRIDLESTDPAIRAHEELETRSQVARVKRIAGARGGIGYVVIDGFSNAGPEFDEALTRFQVHLALAASAEDTSGSQLTYTRTLRMSADLRALGNAYVEGRREIADIATAVAATAVGVGISIALGPVAPLAWTMMAGAVGAGASAAATRWYLEGPAYVSNAEMTGDFASGAAEGLVDAAAGGVIKGATLGLRATTAGSRSLAGRTANTVARALMEGETASRPLVRVGRPMVLGMMEGMAGGASAAVLQTAMDRATWGQSQWRVFCRFIESALMGAGFGGTFGVVGGSLGSLAEFTGEAGMRGRLYGWLLDTNELGLISDLDASKWSKLSEARALMDAGDLAGARAKLAEIEIGSVDMVARLLDPLIERGTVPLARALDELRAARGAMDDLLAADPLGDLEIVPVHPTKLGARGRGGAEIHIELRESGPPKLTLLVDETADSKVLREELLHVSDILYGEAAHRTWWSELTDTKLENWASRSPLEKLTAREAYLELEAINNQHVLESFPDPDVLDDDQLFSLASAREHAVENRRELAATRAAKAEEAAGGSPDIAGIDLDEAPFLTARRRKPDVLWAEVLGDATLVPQVQASFGRLVGQLGTDITPSTAIRSGWRRRVRRTAAHTPFGTSTDVDVVQVGGVLRFTKGDLDAGSPDPMAPATYFDLKEWGALRDDLEEKLEAAVTVAVAAAAPALTPIQIKAIVKVMLDGMADSPVGFVYGTTPMRVFGYAEGYTANVVAGGPSRSEDLGELHHLTPLYLLGRKQLDLQSITGIPGNISMSLVDLDTVAHDSIHELMNSVKIFPTGAPTGGIGISPHELLEKFGSRLQPGAAMIESNGNMTIYAWDKDKKSFSPLVP